MYITTSLQPFNDQILLFEVLMIGRAMCIAVNVGGIYLRSPRMSTACHVPNHKLFAMQHRRCGSGPDLDDKVSSPSMVKSACYRLTVFALPVPYSLGSRCRNNGAEFCWQMSFIGNVLV